MRHSLEALGHEICGDDELLCVVRVRVTVPREEQIAREQVGQRSALRQCGTRERLIARRLVMRVLRKPQSVS